MRSAARSRQLSRTADDALRLLVIEEIVGTLGAGEGGLHLVLPAVILLLLLLHLVLLFAEFTL